jgi:FtsP/CotA-like multicopper oxidase with cupredoxin domain
MSRSQRLTFLAIAAVIAVVAVVVLAGGSDDTGDERAATPTPTPTATPESEGMAEESEATPTPTPSPTRTPDPIPVLRPGTKKTVQAKQGERVRFRIRSPEPEEMHLHGYDIYRDLPAGETVTVTLDDPQLTGIYEIELHNSGEEIGSLRVEP